MKVEIIKTSTLKRAQYNPRKISDDQLEQLKKSLKNFGLVEPLVVNNHSKRNNIIIGGHQRLKAWEELGHDVVPVIYVKLSLAKEKELNIRLNKNAGDFDFSILANEFNVDDLVDWGFDSDDFGIGEEEAIKEDTIPEPPKKAKSKRGDIYQLGEHRLMCGDSTSSTEVEKLMSGELADMLLTDPPYNVDYTGKTKDSLKIKNDKFDNDSFREFLKDAFTEAATHLKSGAVFYIWHSDSEGYNFRGACFDVGLQVRQCLIWKKSSMVMGRQDYHWQHEPCLYGWKSGAAHLWATDRKQTTILEFERPSRSKEHPTMKPVKLLAYQIANNTKGMDIVLDLFGGGGSTLIACEQLKRKCIMMELDPKYIDVIIERWENLTGKKAKLIN